MREASYYKRGILMGSLLGGTLMWFSLSKQGRAMREQIRTHAAVVYEDVSARVLASDAWQRMSRSQFMQMVNDAVERYAINLGIADDVRRVITRLVNRKWHTMQRDIRKRERRIAKE